MCREGGGGGGELRKEEGGVIETEVWVGCGFGLQKGMNAL